MRRCAALLLLVSAWLPGCRLTRTVWRAGNAVEVPTPVSEVVVSPNGDVSVLYAACRYELRWGIGFIEPREVHVPSRSPDRVILIPRSEMERVLARTERGLFPELSGEELRKFLLPSPSARPEGASVRPEVYYMARPSCGAVLLGMEPLEALHVAGVSFSYPRPSRNGKGGGARPLDEVTVRLIPPSELTRNTASVAVRVLLTPPAAAADVASDAFLLPWVVLRGMLLSAMRSASGGSWKVY